MNKNNFTDFMAQDDVQKEIDFWKNYNFENENFKHKYFYEEFFNFQEINGECLEIGCGGAPFYSYSSNNNHYKLTLVDPILNELIKIQKYKHLSTNIIYSNSFSEIIFDKKYDYIICLNMLDHFENNHIEFLMKINEILNSKGKLLLYYDIREKISDNHYPIEHEKILKFIKENFKICKDSLLTNPSHKNWSTVYSSYRVILEKI